VVEPGHDPAGSNNWNKNKIKLFCDILFWNAERALA
jgi:hypothetical protein